MYGAEYIVILYNMFVAVNEVCVLCTVQSI